MSCQGRGALEAYKTKLNTRKKAFTTTKTRNINHSANVIHMYDIEL
jgi:hypothetical protein